MSARFARWALSTLALGCVDEALVGEFGRSTGATPDAANLTDGAISADGRIGGGDGSLDAGECVPHCAPTTCGARLCGRSECGYYCGACDPGEWCSGGACVPGPAPESCVDGFAAILWEGNAGFLDCPSDEELIAPCECGAAGECVLTGDPCMPRCFPPILGSACDGDEDCGPGGFCATSAGRCGVPCARGTAEECIEGYVCVLTNGDDGVCLPACGICAGAGQCEQELECRPALMPGIFACVPRDVATAACP